MDPLYPSVIAQCRMLIRLLTVGGLVAIATKLFSFWYSRRRLRELADRLPGPRPLPIVGDLLRFSGGPDEMMNVVLSLVDRYGDTCRIWVGHKLYVVLTDPRDIGVILGSLEILSRDRAINKVADPLFGQGLITSSGDMWKLHRKIINPSFNVKTLQEYIDDFNHYADCLVETLDPIADGSTFDIFNLVGSVTFNALCATVMGTTAFSVHNCKEALENLVRSISIGEERFLQPWLLSDSLFKFTQLYKYQEDVLKVLHNFADNIISNRNRTRYDRKRVIERTDSNKSIKTKIMVDAILNASENYGHRFTSKHSRDHVITMMTAGYETTSTATCFALLLLAMFPRVQRNVMREQMEIFGEDLLRPCSVNDTRQMSYLDMVIKETLRMYPPAPVIHREIDKETAINKYTLPAGCSVIILNYKSQRHPDHFKHPDHFLPERFSLENSKGRHPYAYIPFGAGPRNCVGRNYALLQLKVMLSAVLRRFRVESRLTWEDLRHFRHGIVLKPACGFPVELFPRDEQDLKICASSDDSRRGSLVSI